MSRFHFQVTQGCGLNHAAVYRRNTGREPNSNTMSYINIACDNWRDAVDEGAEHSICSRLWDGLMRALGTR